MAKKISGYIKLQVPAGTANPSPPLGPALGQRGVNIMEFCKAFNAATDGLEKGQPTPTIITVFADKSFSFVTKTPPATYLIKKAANLKSGSKEPGKISGGKINPLIGSAGIASVPIAARVSHIVANQANPHNHLIFHAMGPNLAGVFGTAISGGIMLALLGVQ